MFIKYAEEKGFKSTYIPNIKNEGLNINSDFYDWNTYFQVNDFQVVIDCDNETIKVLDHLKEVRTSKEKSEIKKLIQEYANLHNLKILN